MARYDAGWGRFGEPGREWAGREERPGRGRGGYDEIDYRGGWRPDEGAGAVVYGPERYGLGPYHERLRKRRRPDSELSVEVRDALFYDTWVDAEAIDVEVSDGVVTLKGELPSYEEIRYATDDAWDVEGVVGVRSELTVRAD